MSGKSMQTTYRHDIINMDYVHHIHYFPPVCRQRPLKIKFELSVCAKKNLSSKKKRKKKTYRSFGAAQTFHPIITAADLTLWALFTWLVPHHFYWGFCAADPAGFCWVAPSAPLSCPALAGVEARTPRTKAAPAFPRFRLESCSPALYASPCPAPPRHPPRLRPPLPPRRDRLAWALRRDVRVPPQPRPRRPPSLSGLRPRAGIRRPVRRKSRRPRSLRLLWVARSSRLTGHHSSCSYQEHSEAGEINQTELREGGSAQVSPNLGLARRPQCSGEMRLGL